MPINPAIALSARPVETPDVLSMFGKVAAIQQAQNQNALAQYQLGAAQREEETTNALSRAYQAAYNPETGKIDAAKLRQSLAVGGFGAKIPTVEKALGELETQTLTRQKLQTDLVDAKIKQSRAFLDTIDVTDPNAPAQYLAWHEANHRDPILGPALEARGVTADQSRARIEKTLQQGPQAFAQLLAQSKVGAEKFMELNKPSVTSQDTGAGGRLISRPGLGGPATVVPGSEFTKTQTFADRTAAARLAFEQQKFAWEKANPGYELKEDSEGNMFGVNKRTLQAVPVMVGGQTTTAPAAETPAAGGGIPGARIPAPAGAPGQQFAGKGTALTESQGNAAAYGLRMKEANAILEPLEETGVKNTGLISGVVGGTVGLTPYLGDKLESTTGSIFNALPQIMGGLSPEQQQVAQARINFITAVLRKESGAAISPSEFTTAEKNYFPKPGDSDAVIAQKQKARQTAIKAMEIQAGPGAKYIKSAQPEGGALNPTANDPLGLGVR